MASLILLLGGGAFFLYVVVGIVYRLYLSPLASVPGPRLAALTGYYELYHDLFQGARFPWLIQQLHQQYGPIVRISPHEVHIEDPDFANVHFSSSTAIKKNKYGPHENEFGTPETIHSTIDADIHHSRRKPLACFLSKPEVAAHEVMVKSKVDTLCSRLDRLKGSGQSVDLRLLFYCEAIDILTEYAFPNGIDFLGQADIDPEWRDMQVGGLRKFHFFKHFPIIWKVLQSLPESMFLRAMPSLKIRFDWQDEQKALVKEIFKANVPGKNSSDHPTIFQAMLQSDVPPQEKNFERLWQEGQALLGAGVETTSNALTVIVFNVLNDPSCLARLKQELKDAMPDATRLVSVAELEKLPYLTGVIVEGLRMAVGVTARFIRVAPTEEIHYQQFKLPPGTAISMSAMLQNQNPGVFPDSSSFKPERWMKGDVDRANLLTFSRGRRQCLGINLAYAELYTTVAALFRRFDLDLFETTAADIEPAVCGFQPLPAEESKGVRVTVR